MAQVQAIDSLIAARDSLKTGLQKSKDIASALARTGPRLREIQNRLPSLKPQVALLPESTNIVAILDQIDHAIGPASAVLNVFNAVCELQKSLLATDPCSNLSTYISTMKQLEESLRFLSDNCKLAIQWFEGVDEFFQDNSTIINSRCLTNVKRYLRILHKLQASEEHSRLDGGLLGAALDRLQFEFRKLLTENSDPFPVSIVQKLHTIFVRLSANNRAEKCVYIYIEVRSLYARQSLHDLDLSYLEMPITETTEVESIEGYIDKWSKHLDLAVKHLLEHEYNLSNDIFPDNKGSDAGSRCFAKVVLQSGFLSFLHFGKKVVQCKKDPVKLLKLLDIFYVLNNLRTDMNKLFGGTNACAEIQILTRDLVKGVINGICGIFWDLPVQVELQRRSSPPGDGGVPRLVSFVTDYCNKLLGDRYRTILTQVLIIHQSWKQEMYREDLLCIQIYSMIKQLALNLDAWSKAYEDISQSYYFMMNNHCHFSNLRGTRLGDMMGEPWIKAHGQFKDYYAALYLRESWERPLNLLISHKGQVSFPGREMDRNDLLKKRLKEFNDGFIERYKKQSNWIVSDESLRNKLCLLLVQAIVPVYRSYMKNYISLIEQDSSASKYVKYTAQSLENMLNSLFQQKVSKNESQRHAHLIGKIKNVVNNQLCLTLTAS